MPRCAVVGSNNTVVNVIVATPGVDTPPSGTTLVVSETAGIGWVWNGTTFSGPNPPTPTGPIVPQSITPRQCRLLLLQQGLLSTVEAMIAQQDEAKRITWEYALEFRRDDPLLTQLATNLGLTSQQIDEFFIAASNL